MATNPDSALLLCEEVLAQANKEAQEILSRAREDVEAALAGAASKAETTVKEQLERARQEAARRREMIEATVAVETARMRAERIEALLGSVYEEAGRRLASREGFEYKETIVALASGAITRMGGDAFVVWISEADRSVLGDGLAKAIADLAGRPAETIRVSYSADITGGGLVVEDGEARRVWDNRFAKRLERMWPELRRHIAVRASFIPSAGPGEENS